MASYDDVLSFDEHALLQLRSLYRQFGYSRFKMSRFEEYALYADNKSFLSSDDIITFTDAGGRLLALRPDVTLSIVKGVKDDGALKKLYYNENIYRPGGAERVFRERMQMGLECLGELGVYETGEVIMLAAKTLSLLAETVCLDVSHMGFISGFMEDAGVTDAQREVLLRRISEKNVPELLFACDSFGLGTDFTERVVKLAAVYGPLKDVLGELQAISSCEKTDSALRELAEVFSVLEAFGVAEAIKIDFSIVNDLTYYSGVIFQGYIDGIPSKVLSGGRYDRLMRKFGKKSGAIGFALYLGMLERLSPPRGGISVDVLLLHDCGADPAMLAGAVKLFTDDGKSVRVQNADSGGIKYKRLMRLSEGGPADA